MDTTTDLVVRIESGRWVLAVAGEDVATFADKPAAMRLAREVAAGLTHEGVLGCLFWRDESGRLHREALDQG